MASSLLLTLRAIVRVDDRAPGVFNIGWMRAVTASWKDHVAEFRKPARRLFIVTGNELFVVAAAIVVPTAVAVATAIAVATAVSVTVAIAAAIAIPAAVAGRSGRRAGRFALGLGR